MSWTEADLDRTETRAQSIADDAAEIPACSDDGDTMLALVKEVRRLRALAREALDDGYLA